MDDTFGSRVEAVIDDKHLKKSEFCKQTGFSHVTLSNIINGKTLLPSISILKVFAEHFPEVDLNWVVSGRGKMYRPAGEVLDEVDKDKMSLLSGDVQETAMELISTQKKLVETQQKLNEMMARDIARLSEGIKKNDPELGDRLGL